ncbi:MAG: transcription termination factor NusA [bacterium]|nr:transcription termination factor NusA [bacterium]
MMDLKVLNSALHQLEEERGIPKEKIIEAIEQALAAAYKKDYGKKGQIVKAQFDLSSGKTEFFQIKIAVEQSMLRPEIEEGTEDTPTEFTEKKGQTENVIDEVGEKLIRFNPEQHIMIDDARKIKKGVEPGDELIFPLESRDEYGRIAAQTAKQVIIQRIREAEKVSVLDEYGKKQGEIVNGTVQRMERGNIFIDLGKTTGILSYHEQIPGERYKQGERIRAYLYAVEETPRGIDLHLSRSHPKFIQKLFEVEAPEIANGVVEIKAIAREAGSRSKIAVTSNDTHVDPVGSCVGQRGVRVSTVMSELGGEKIDIIEWSGEQKKFIEDALSPAKVMSVDLNEAEHLASVKVSEDQLSLAIGKGGQNVRLAAKLSGWKIDIKGVDGGSVLPAETDTSGAVDTR